jgi:hypothetical protein
MNDRRLHAIGGGGIDDIGHGQTGADHQHSLIAGERQVGGSRIAYVGRVVDDRLGLRKRRWWRIA